MIDEDFSIPPYSMSKDEKHGFLTKRLGDLTRYHYEHCQEYKGMLNLLDYNVDNITSYYDIPYLPVRLFKELDLVSIDKNDIIKTMTSSGTTGQAVSKIYLDKTTASNQQKTLAKIVSHYSGSARMPMLIVDCPSVLKNRQMFSARGAGILGFSIFGTDTTYILDDDMKLNTKVLNEFLEKHKNKKIFLFGFTFMIWQHFYKELLQLQGNGVELDLSNAVLIHGGGWKKLKHEAVSSKEFNDRLNAACGLKSIHDYYGMVEQTGCIHMQCEQGHLHSSVFSDVIIRNPIDFSISNVGEKGIIQVLSIIPESYPGHSLLTEDEGILIGEDDCACGRRGKYFKVLGRLENAELRGAVILMLHNFDRLRNESSKIKFLVGNIDSLEMMAHLSASTPFSEEILFFLNCVSKELMQNQQIKKFGDVLTFAFWCRYSSTRKMKHNYENGLKDESGIRLGRGIVFHIAPSNVAVNFAYSLAVGLLAGNANIVRLPSKGFPQVDMICSAINKVLQEHVRFKGYLALVRYDHNQTITDQFSLLCDTRVIWGGDQTIYTIRKSALKPRASEICFSDRYSICLIDSDAYLAIPDKNITARKFYNDTYLNDQNACTSPKLVVWLGGSVREAQDVFWRTLHNLIVKEYQMQAIQAVDKLDALYRFGAMKQGKNNGKLIYDNGDNYITRVSIEKLSEDVLDSSTNSGFFFEYKTTDLRDLLPICNTGLQTIGVLGVSKETIQRFIIENRPQGIDRVVNVGETLDFDLVWDGYDLIHHMSRKISLFC